MHEPPTQRQLEFIESIEELVSEKFHGKTKEEASAYISKNIEEFRLKSLLLDSWNSDYI